MTPSWELLLSTIGEEIVSHLLTRPILVPCENGSFIQVIYCNKRYKYYLFYFFHLFIFHS